MTSLIFFGSDRYSAIVLNFLLSTDLRLYGYTDLRIITDQPKPKDRDQVVESNPVEKISIKHNLKVSYYQDLDHSLITENALGLCASFDHLIPADIIDLFVGNLYNLHPSLLPQYRNVSPVQYAIALGDTETGITLFRITTGIDNGEIIAQASEPILEDDTTPTLTSRLFAKGAELFLSFLDNPTQIPAHHSEARQSEGWIFTKRLTRDSGYIEWPILHKLLKNQPVSVGESTNALLNLRLQKIESKGLIIDNWLLVINDLLRSLSPWPTVWSLVPSKKGELRVTLESVLPEITLKIAGKPKPITYTDFTKYYL